MTGQQEIQNFISPERLYAAAAFFSIITLAVVAMIYIRLYIKKKTHFGHARITEQLNEWISEALLEETTVNITMQPWLMQYFAKEVHRRYVTDSLINAKKNLKGAASNSIVDLYLKLGLKKDSLNRMRSLVWHKKARGIYELYMMGQQDMAAEIERHTNSWFEGVRAEAQTATVGFKGFAGLEFLSILTQPLNEWQQLKLLEQLHKLNVEEMPGLPGWLASPNLQVQIFALKIADIYNQFHVHDQVAELLCADNEALRTQAIKTLGRIGNEETAGIMRDQYRQETQGNKKLILRQLGMVGSDLDRNFLMERMNEEDDGLKLEAMRAMAQCDAEGWDELLSLANDNTVLNSISKQVLYELEQ
ncbi:MAG: HEAT repeat domain-containing protein [Taibaiella sp.]|nr:HEAT repeat domain-containing protein [Taibaiella sp.]